MMNASAATEQVTSNLQSDSTVSKSGKGSKEVESPSLIATSTVSPSGLSDQDAKPGQHDRDRPLDLNGEVQDDLDAATTVSTSLEDSDALVASDDPDSTDAASEVEAGPKYVLTIGYVLEVRGNDGKVTRTQQIRSVFAGLVHDRWQDQKEIPALEQIIYRPDDDDGERRFYLKIHSPFIINVLRSIVRYTIKDTLDHTQVEIEAPYELLYSHEDELRAYEHPATHSEEYREECDEHIAFLLKFLAEQKSYSRGLQIEKQRWKSKVAVATFRRLWLLLRPGQLALVRNDDQLEPFWIHSVTGGPEKGIPKNYQVAVWNFQYDGRFFGRVLHTVDLEPFDGEVEIAKLEVFPAKYDANIAQKRVQFIERGKRYFNIVKDVSYKEYNGIAIHGVKKQYSHARIIVDYSAESWRSIPTSVYDPTIGSVPPDALVSRTCSCVACEAAAADKSTFTGTYFDGWDFKRRSDVTTLDDQQYMLCPRAVHGYILTERKWRVLDIRDIQDPKFDDGIMDRMTLDDDKKNILRAICRQHAVKGQASASRISDIVSGKGDGKIFLLHGSPGVGKTLTAECVAESTRRPLLTITAGDLGIKAAEVEDNLKTFFTKAEEWHAILLLDEADIYLQTRGPSDLERNAVVSVFLRALEYYDGILFITTNRVGQLDEAFKSRIHVSILYPPFTDEMRAELWDRHFDRLMNERSKDFDKPAYSVAGYVKQDPEVLQLKWNGREIRNGFQTAITLAEFDRKEGQKIKIEKKHLQQVVKMSRTFTEYLHTTLGETEEKLAKLRRFRADDFEEGMVGKVVVQTLKTLAAKSHERGHTELAMPDNQKGGA